ncbi:hypothetical protein KEM55_007472 [Ascosphaera atra]|nr:hypothetical protein KEM55_007472 [Ascosphaera atra]
MANAAAKEKALKMINDNAVVVFSKTYCPYCTATKNLLRDAKAKFTLLELDTIDDGAAIQRALEEISNQRTVPNIFIGQKHIGGNSDLQAKKAELPQLLKAVNAV